MNVWIELRLTYTNLLANSRETILESFLLHKRTFNTVHDGIHHLKKKEVERQEMTCVGGGIVGGDVCFFNNFVRVNNLTSDI